MQQKIHIVFFGSFLHYSAYVLESLIESGIFEVVSVVTTPPLIDKKGEHKNPVHLLAEQHSITVYTPDELTDDALTIINQRPTTNGNSIDLFLTAGYGKLLPASWLDAPKIASLNLHLSLLPNYRGANPGEWALLMGEKTSGVTLIEMSEKFDTGNIIATHEVEILKHETRETLYEKLYTQGGIVLPSLLQRYLEFKRSDSQLNATELQQFSRNATKLHLPPLTQPLKGIYARRLKREDGFIAWEVLQQLMDSIEPSGNVWPLYTEVLSKQPHGQWPMAMIVERASRALAGFPTLWTEIQTKNGVTRMKIIDVSINQGKLVLEKVHIAGKQPARWNEVKNILA